MLYYGNKCQISVDKLIALDNSSLKNFRGQRKEHAKELIKQGKQLEPLVVMPAQDGCYSVIRGHYRLAAARDLGVNKLPVIIIKDGLTAEELISLIPIEGLYGIYIHYKIDINDKDFNKTDAYKEHAGMTFGTYDGVSLTLGEYIERFLLADFDLYDYHESIFSMGNPYELDLGSEEELFTLVATEIAEQTGVEAEDRTSELTKTLQNYPTLIKKYFGLDLTLFDDSEHGSRCEIAKILYYFYMLKHQEFPQVNIFDLLSKPSMENIALADFLQETYNGHIIHRVLMDIRKELPLSVIGEIEHTVFTMSLIWDEYLLNLYLSTFQDIANDTEKGLQFETLISEKIQNLNKPTPWSRDENDAYDLSPVATLYLFIIRYQYIGQAIDTMRVNAVQIDSDYNISPELVAKLRRMTAQHVRISDIETYIDDHADEIAACVYPGRTITRNDRKKIRQHGEKVRALVEFCHRARPFNRVDDNVESALFILSCMQAILLDSQNETFDYIYSGYQRNTKHRPRVQKALKGDPHPVDALKMYWVRKIMEHWHANVGVSVQWRMFKDFETIYNQKWLEVLSCQSLSGMIKLHEFYQKQLGNTANLVAFIEDQRQ